MCAHGFAIANTTELLSLSCWRRGTAVKKRSGCLMVEDLLAASIDDIDVLP